MPHDHSPMDETSDCTPCGLHQPVRSAYFDGKMLTARDLTAEQNYMNGMRYLGHSLLDGSGTVCGLKVQSHPQDGCKSSHLVLSKGMALTCAGQEIILPQDVTIPVQKMIQDDPDLQADLNGKNDLVISICRQDHPSEFAPVLISDCCSGLDGKLPNRIAEGYSFKLSAKAPASRIKERNVLQPDLAWVHSINTDDETPSVVAIDDQEGLVYVASQIGNQTTIRAYDALTHAQKLTLTGWQRIDDIIASGAGNWLFVSGIRDKQRVLSLYPRSPIHFGTPSKSFVINGMAQLALSPATNALFALILDKDKKPQLLGWSEDQLSANLAQPSLSLSGTQAINIGPQQAGTRLIEVSPDGRKLAFLLPGLPKALHLGQVADLLSGSVTNMASLATEIRTELGDDVTQTYAGASSLKFSFDSLLLHVIGRRDPAPDLGFYTRVFLNTTGPTQTGQGLHFTLTDNGNTYASLYVAPDERWIYISSATYIGDIGEKNGVLAVFSSEPAKQPGVVSARTNPIQIIPLAAQLSGGALRIRGSRAYLPGFERGASNLPEVAQLLTNPEQILLPTTPLTGGLRPRSQPLEIPAIAPNKGRVMVVDIAETNIPAIFEAAIDGCTSCGTACSCVTLAHIPHYAYHADAKSFPRIMDMGLGGASDVEIDNLTYRPIVPSNVTLMEAILEIAARGVESGPPGPRGNNGLQGAAGANGLNGTNGTNGANGTSGQDGARGISIAEVAFDTVNTPRLDPILGPDSDLRLVLPTPADSAPVLLPDDYQFVTTTNWEHGKIFALADLEQGALPEMNFVLRRPVSNSDQLFTTAVAGIAKHFYFAGVLEIRVHSHQDSFNDGEESKWTANLQASRTFQFSPRFAEPHKVFNSNTFMLPMIDLWAGLRQMEITRARIEVILHGSFLTNEDKAPFDGRPNPVVQENQAGKTGGTWRSWIEVQNINEGH